MTEHPGFPSLGPMPSLGIGLIGVGKHGIRYAQHLRRDAPTLRLAAIWRRDRDAARRQAEEFGCVPYEDFRELIAARDVAAVIVVVPPSLHREIVCAAAEAGKPILLEKPAAPTLEEGRAMLAAVRRHSVPVLMAQTLRYNSVVRTLRAVADRLGTLHALRLSQRFEPSRPGWIDDPAVAGGGVILHTGVHSFDLLRHLSGQEVERVGCETASVGTELTEDNFVATARFTDPRLLASIAGSRATASRTGPIELAGQHGQLVADHVFGTVHWVRGTDVQALDVPPPVPTVREILADFARMLEGAPSPIPLAEGVRAVAIARACYTSAERGTMVPVAAIE